MLRLNSGRGEGLVGIWWYVDGDIWGVSTSLDNAKLDGRYYQYSLDKNHFNLWETIRKEFDVQDKYKNFSYRGVERGRVIFDTMTQVYVITCSKELLNDSDFRNACIDFYNLRGNRIEFEALPHYHVYDDTGNPALERFLMDL